MGKVGTYLYFNGKAMEAFDFYRSVFGGDFTSVMRYGDNPPAMQSMGISEDHKDLIMHISLPILDGHLLMGSDMTEPVNHGNNFSITLEPESKQEARDLFSKLSAGGKVDVDLHESFWGSYHANFRDKYGIGWMLDYDLSKEG
jgi:PhnB protein